MPHLNIAPPNMGIIYKSHQSIPVFKIHEAWSTFWRSRRHATSSRVRQGPSDGAASSHGSCSHQNPPKGCWIWLVYPAYFNQLVAIVVANRYIPIISINNKNFCWASIIQSLKCWGHNNLLGFALISGINSRDSPNAQLAELARSARCATQNTNQVERTEHHPSKKADGTWWKI